MSDLSFFSPGNISRPLSLINASINHEYQKPFPEPKEQMLSWYEYKNRWVKILPNGYLNITRLVTSLIDFTFIRSLVADAYSNEGAPCYDPVSLFLCDLFRFPGGFRSMKDFCKVLHDRFNGHPCRTYAGIRESDIPCEATFSHFRVIIGETRYKAIFHVLV